MSNPSPKLPDPGGKKRPARHYLDTVVAHGDASIAASVRDRIADELSTRTANKQVKARWAVAAGLALAVLSLSACGLAGRTTVVTAAPAPASSTSAAPVAVTSSAAPSPSVVTVTKHPARKVVTHVVEQAPATQYVAPQPSSYSSVLNTYDSAMSTENDAFYDGSGAYFVSPSGNIACFISSSVSCSIHHYDFPQPGPDCNSGIAATVDDYTYPELTDCSGYFGTDIGAPVLQYGQSVSYGDLACVSESSAISCLDFDNDTGFSLSRQAFSPVG